jgi:hypothetical protein
VCVCGILYLISEVARIELRLAEMMLKYFGIVVGNVGGVTESFLLTVLHGSKLQETLSQTVKTSIIPKYTLLTYTFGIVEPILIVSSLNDFVCHARF